MALIKCSHCGQPVSDTVEKCIHCGNNILPVTVLVDEENATQKPLEYNDLSNVEKARLWSEFQLAYPKQQKFEQREAKLKLMEKISSGVVGVAGVSAVLVYYFAKDKQALLFTVLFLCLFIFFAALVIDIVGAVLILKAKKKSLVALRMFQQWLTDNKGINYSVVFNECDARQKKYFDSINLTAQGYRG